MGHYIHIVVFLTVSRGKTADQAVEKFLRKTRELDSYGAIFNIVQVHMHLRVAVFPMICSAKVFLALISDSVH